MNLKKITAIMIGAVMAVSMAVPAMADDKVETVTDGKLTVATSPDFAPYEFYSIDEDGTRHFPDLIWIWLSTSQTRWDWNWK